MRRADPERAEARTAWGWLGALLERRERPAALRHALCELGWDARVLRRGLADQLRVSERELEHPDLDAIRRCRRDRAAGLLVAVLDPVARDDGARPEAWLIEGARRWLAAAPVLYELEPRVLEAWLREDAELGRALAPTLAREGLALLGASALRRLARQAPTATRALVCAWVARLDGRG